MRRSEDTESFIKAINNLKLYTVIVEGKRDKRALEKFGLDEKKIIAINGRTLIKVVDEIRAADQEPAKRQVIILTDFDEKGRKIASKLRRLLLAYRVHPNSRLRHEIMKFGRAEIEDLATLFEIDEVDIKLGRGDSHGEISANFNKVRNKGKDKGKRNSGKTRHNRSGIRAD